MSNIKIGAVFLNRDKSVFEIVNINQHLMLMSVRNKAITVKELNTNDEYLVSVDHLESDDFKYLNNNPDAARTLYSSTIKEPINAQSDSDFDYVMAKYDIGEY